MYGPVHEQEEARLKLFGLVQHGNLDAYVQEFTNLCLQVNDLNDHSKAVLFVRGLHAAIGHSALREHPTTLGQAIRAARMAAMQASGVWREQATTGTGIRRSRHPGPAPHAQASTPRQPVSPWGRQQQQSNRTSEPICPHFNASWPNDCLQGIREAPDGVCPACVDGRASQPHPTSG